jgi:hypothetical protein
MRQVSPRDHDDAPRTRLDEFAHTVDEASHPRVRRRIAPRRLRRAEASQNGDDLEVAAGEHVLQKDDLKLERVLPLVVELVRVRVESFGACGQAIDRFRVGGDRTERRIEDFAAERKGLTHWGVRGPPEDEGVGLRRERSAQRAVGVTVPESAAAPFAALPAPGSRFARERQLSSM